MRVAWIEPVGGASGNMLLGAVIDAGVDLEALLGSLRSLPVEPWDLVAERVHRGGIAAVHVDVRTTPSHHERHLQDIRAILDGADLDARVKEQARGVFEKLAEAEGRVHGIAPEQVHFHEVGAVDAIVDVVGTVLGLRMLGVEEVHCCGPLPAGFGTITCAHGTIPNPAPATVELCRGIPTRQVDVEAELVTPTGAALITGLAASYQPRGAMSMERVGYGAGSRDLPISNVTRLRIGQSEPLGGLERDRIVLLATNLDDMNPQVYEHVMDRLFESGALDVWMTPVQMKKNRPGIHLTVLSPDGREEELARILLEETTTLGVRVQEIPRLRLPRETVTLRTRLGLVRVKRTRGEGVPSRVQPEYEDCRRIAKERNLPLLAVLEQVKEDLRDFS